MGKEENTGGVYEAEELEAVDEAEQTAENSDLLSSGEYTEWSRSALKDQVPSLFLDKSLKIIAYNVSFCALYSCDVEPTGQYFTQFFSPFFDAKKSGELFRAILSPETGFTWSGRVEKTVKKQLMTISKVWVVPLLTVESRKPEAYGAFCLDISTEYRQLLANTFESLLGAARLKDNDTGNHIERVNRYAHVLSESLMDNPEEPDVDRQFIESISQVAALHDIGKIGTPDDILNKAGSLEAWEWDVMKQHTTNGAYILGTYPNPMAREIALRHHERWDGLGYPHELTGKLIPLAARIVSIADVYDALRMPRAYKEPYPHIRAVETIQREKGTHFDPFLVDTFTVIAEDFNSIFSELADSP
jgi:HD-GYP domain-containing protein (c-di-GMP phosphodiesterase class II)